MELKKNWIERRTSLVPFPWIRQCNDMCTNGMDITTSLCHRWLLIRRNLSQTFIHRILFQTDQFDVSNALKHICEAEYKTVNSNWWYHALVSLKVEECKKCMYLSSMGMRERFTVVLLMVLMLSVILIIREQRRISACKSWYSFLPSFYSFRLHQLTDSTDK